MEHVQSEDMFINWKGFMVYIFYVLSVVGNDIYSMYTKMGGGTRSARRYRRDCASVQFKKTYTPSVTAGIRCDERNNYVLPQRGEIGGGYFGDTRLCILHPHSFSFLTTLSCNLIAPYVIIKQGI